MNLVYLMSNYENNPKTTLNKWTKEKFVYLLAYNDASVAPCLKG